MGNWDFTEQVPTTERGGGAGALATHTGTYPVCLKSVDPPGLPNYRKAQMWSVDHQIAEGHKPDGLSESKSNLLPKSDGDGGAGGCQES